MNPNQFLLTTIISSLIIVVSTYFLTYSITACIVAVVVLCLNNAVINTAFKQNGDGSQSITTQAASVDAKETLYVGNIPYKASEKDIKKYFENVVPVLSVRLMTDKKSGRKKGFGFVEVPQGNSKNTIKKLHDSVFMERSLIVRTAHEKPSN